MAEHSSDVPSQFAPIEEESTIWQKCKESPFVPIGIVGTAGMVGWGAYNFKNRGAMSTSVYLMHLRVKAQSFVVGAMTLGIMYKMGVDYFRAKQTTKEQEVDKQ